jgi:hypothetical protein
MRGFAVTSCGFILSLTVAYESAMLMASDALACRMCQR